MVCHMMMIDLLAVWMVVVVNRVLETSSEGQTLGMEGLIPDFEQEFDEGLNLKIHMLLEWSVIFFILPFDPCPEKGLLLLSRTSLLLRLLFTLKFSLFCPFCVLS